MKTPFQRNKPIENHLREVLKELVPLAQSTIDAYQNELLRHEEKYGRGPRWWWLAIRHADLLLLHSLMKRIAK